jgi:hypothetical protein
MKNPYGNYVVQKALKIATDNNKKLLITTIINNVEKLNDRKLIFKWKTIISSAVISNNVPLSNNKNKYNNNNNNFKINYSCNDEHNTFLSPQNNPYNKFYDEKYIDDSSNLNQHMLSDNIFDMQGRGKLMKEIY